eukprot:1395203-Amorphochlora_amoeboformis.AAC.1
MEILLFAGCSADCSREELEEWKQADTVDTSSPISRAVRSIPLDERDYKYIATKRRISFKAQLQRNRSYLSFKFEAGFGKYSPTASA